ncbi:hypothetical protein FIBSPDRAFT_942658 [Athelia psychrophila]|uniref:TOG domain-containing protein n=1 Tax=Athelia psychrophila TaxID=1759441 RepID=A0A166X994_9AGAM|nr:hypothetical protein FIBSPDRAFT_942658 [Fibularhizoctonia sp. CBS 109695]
MSSMECRSSISLNRELEVICAVVVLPESEDSWEKIAKGITRIITLSNNGALDFPDDLVLGIRSMSRPLISAMCSERSRLSGAAIDMLHTLACGLGSDAEPLIPIFLPTLVTLCTRTSKVFVTRARTCILAFIENTQLPTILPYLALAAKDKSVTLRVVAVESVLSCLNCFNPPDMEKESRATMIEGIIKLTAKDANADVRRLSRKVFEAYKALMPTRLEKFIRPLTPMTKKYLEIKAQPTSSAPPSRPPSSTSFIDKPTQPPKVKPTVQKETMPPPPYVPVRSAPPTRPARTTPSTTNVSDPVAEPARSGPSRPRAPHVTMPSVPVMARRLAPFQPSTTAVISSGPHRVNRANDEPLRNEGPLRRPLSQSQLLQAPESDTAPKPRPQGGARRVPLPPPPSAPKAEGISKDVPDNAQSTSKSTTAASTLSRSAPSKITPEAIPTKRGPSKADERPKPIPKPPAKPASTDTRVSAIQSITNPTKSAREPTRPLEKKTSISQPTLAQIARAKAAAADRKGKEAEKHVWGRPKSASVTKGQAIKSKAAPSALPKAPSGPTITTPAEVPLPPSPSPDVQELPPLPLSPAANRTAEVEAATDQPLPPSPVAPASPLAEVMDVDARAVPKIQIPSESTPTGQSAFPAPAATPISSLLTSIQQGFLFTPCSPLSPPQSYLPLSADDHRDIDSPTPCAKNFAGDVVPEKKIVDLRLVALGENEDGRQVLSDVDMN